MSAMSLKAELETWVSALALYDSQNFDEAILEFDKIADTSKINWNIGIILATMGQHDLAVARFREATAMDGFMTVGYYQAGVSNFMMGKYEAAHKDFEDALLYMRGNQTINYEQLGLPFRLFSAEVLFNAGLAKIYMGQVEAGLADLCDASAQKQIPEHGVIDDAIRDRGVDYNVFSVPVGVLFKPAEGKLKNLKARDYMGKAVLVAASDPSDAYTTFTGITRLRRGQTPTGALLDASHPLSRSASVSAISSGPKDVGTATAAKIGRSKTIAAAIPAAIDRNSLSRSTTSATIRPTAALVSPGIPITDPLRPDRPTLNVDIPRSASSPTPLAQPYPRRATARSPPSENIKTPPQRLDADLRITELYDDYYAEGRFEQDEMPELPLIGGAKKAAAGLSRRPSAGGGGVPPGARPPTLVRGASMRVGRAPPPSSFSSAGVSVGRVGTLRRATSLARSIADSRMSRYDEDEVWVEMVKIRVKVHVGALTRGMSASPLGTYEDFIDSLLSKFPELAAGGLSVRFKDEDGDMLSMQDEGDYEAAVDVARIMAQGRAEGKLEIWVD